MIPCLNKKSMAQEKGSQNKGGRGLSRLRVGVGRFEGFCPDKELFAYSLLLTSVED